MPSTVRCRCKSFCTTYNPLTGLHEGEGFVIPRGTRDKHIKADKRKAAKSLHLVSQPTTLIRQSEDSWVKVFNEELNILVDIPVTSTTTPLVFSDNPSIESSGDYIQPVIATPPVANQGLHRLTGHRANNAFLSHEHRLCQIYAIVVSHPGPVQVGPHVDALLGRVEDELRRIYEEKGAEWMRQRYHSKEDPALVVTNKYLKTVGPQNVTIRAVSVVSLVLEHLFFVPRRALRVQLAGIRSILHTTRADPRVIAHLPQDPRTCASHFNIEPVLKKYVACATCHKLYPYDSASRPDNDTDPLLLQCTHARTPQSSICNTPLWRRIELRSKQHVYIPIRTYVYQDLYSWIGRLVCQPGIEELLDKPLQLHALEESTEPIDDIWQAPGFAELKDSEGRPFLQSCNGDGRLVFSLSIDGFNPHHNKTAKQTLSSTGIWMVLLNLPKSIRYRREFMYLAGIIPGPDKPSKEDLYPYLEILIAQLRHMYVTGVRFSQTHREKLGRLFFAMLVPLICDMLAARQTIGLAASTSHHFCTFCDADIDDLDVMDRNEWPAKDIHQMRHFAILWRDAPNEKVRSSVFEASGVRWSPMWDLPYWDPVRYTVVDSMHALDLNLLQNHCRSLFQISTKTSSGGRPLSIPPASTPLQKRVTTKAHLKLLTACCELIADNTESSDKLMEALLKYPRKVLYTFCLDHGILSPGKSLVVGTKLVLANNIARWRNHTSYTAGDIAGASSIDVDEDEDTGSEAEMDEEEALDTMGDNVPADSKRIIRVIRHLVDLDEPEESRRKAQSQGSKEIFDYICSIIQLDYDKSILKTKRQIYDLISTTIDENPDVYDALRSFVQERVPNPTRAILDRDIMAIIWADMEKTQLPSWISRAPRRWGTTQHGKLSADNWRVICTIHLPISLIREWGRDTGYRKEVLDHFMDLVAAVQLANMKVMTRNQIDTYAFYIHRYISNILRLYPDQKLKPSHHMARHLEDTLKLFGPVHSHSGDHYERFINLFHGINTNKITGQLEETLMKSSARMANVHTLIRSDRSTRASVVDLISKMDQIERQDARGSRLAAMLDPEAPSFSPRHPSISGTLTETDFQKLCAAFPEREAYTPQTVDYLREVSRAGVCYSPSSSSTGRNSAIVFRTSINGEEAREGHKTGIILSIFQHPSFSSSPPIFLTVQEMVRLDPSDELFTWNETYTSYLFGGYLARYPENPSQSCVIHISQIISHCALTPWKLPGQVTEAAPSKPRPFHVLPLDKMGHLVNNNQ